MLKGVEIAVTSEVVGYRALIDRMCMVYRGFKREEESMQENTAEEIRAKMRSEYKFWNRKSKSW